MLGRVLSINKNILGITLFNEGNKMLLAKSASALEPADQNCNRTPDLVLIFESAVVSIVLHFL
jgi:hypothetical protein